MNKEEVLKQLFQLPKNDILDIFEIINGYKERVNKSKKDTLLVRCVFMKNYHSIKEFYEKNKITKDRKDGKRKGYFNIYQAVNGSIQLTMGNYNTTLTAQQILDLNIYTFDLIDYDHDKFLEFYKLGYSNVKD